MSLLAARTRLALQVSQVGINGTTAVDTGTNDIDYRTAAAGAIVEAPGAHDLIIGVTNTSGAESYLTLREESGTGCGLAVPSGQTAWTVLEDAQNLGRHRGALLIDFSPDFTGTISLLRLPDGER